MKYFRTCIQGYKFNSGMSRCPVNPGYPKGLILVERGVKLPEPLTVESFQAAIHADRPNRIYPIKMIEEYAPTGGDAQINATGYGAGKVSGYAARSDAFTLDEYDMEFRRNVVEAKNMRLDLFIVDSNNILYGERIDGTFKGIELSGISISGQDFDSSGAQAQNILNVNYRDIEKHWKNADFIRPDFDIINYMNGLVYVDLVKVDDASNKYKLIEVGSGRLDITEVWGPSIVEKAEKVLSNVTPASVQYENGILTITSDSGKKPLLKKPSILLENDITGIEQIPN